MLGNSDSDGALSSINGNSGCARNVGDFVALHDGARIFRTASVGCMFAQDARSTHGIGRPHL
jgi:hypothetical protein